MTTQFVQVQNGMKLAYDRQGTGPALLLIHGALVNRQAWHQAGYIDRLKSQFTVITLDLWGHGESDALVSPDACSVENFCEAVQAIVEACGFKTFSVWGFSMGGSFALQLAALSGAVQRAIGASCFVGPIPDSFKAMPIRIEAMLQARKANQLDLASLTPLERRLVEHPQAEAFVTLLRAGQNWPAISLSALPCPVLLLAGSADEVFANNLREQSALPHSASLEFQICEGLNHEQTFSNIDVVLPPAEAFLRRETARP